MGFEKGNQHAKGRKRGQGKATSAIKKAFQRLIEDNIEGLQEDISQLKPIDRLKILIDLSTFIVPRLKAIESKHSLTGVNMKPFAIQEIYTTTKEIEIQPHTNTID